MLTPGEGMSDLMHKGILYKDSGKVEKVRAVFKEVEKRFSDHPRVDEAAYYYGICWYNNRNWRKTPSMR